MTAKITTRKQKNSNRTQKINLLFVTWGLYIGGAELVVANLCKNLNKDLFNISVCYLKLDGPIGRELSEKDFKVFTLPKSKLLHTDYISFLKLASIVKQKKIDIIHSQDTASLVDSSLCRLIVPGLKLVHTFHFGNYPHLPGNNLLLEKFCWRVPDKLIAVGNEQRDAIKNTLRIPDQRIITVWNGIEKKEAAIDNNIVKRFSNNKRVVIGALSTLIEQKGLTYLLDVAALLKKSHSNFIFIIAGGGPLLDALESKCRSLGLQDIVFFLGWVEDAASRILPFFDIFFQPSLWEAMSMVLLEAMAAGKPVVATDVGENRYIIDEGENGFLIAPKDIHGMAMALEKLILQPDLREKFGQAGKNKIDKYFNASTMAAAYEKVYQKVLSE
jgi:glycosyltransferase involved in cell wall biosynthesis